MCPWRVRASGCNRAPADSTAPGKLWNRWLMREPRHRQSRRDASAQGASMGSAHLVLDLLPDDAGPARPQRSRAGSRQLTKRQPDHQIRHALHGGMQRQPATSTYSSHLVAIEVHHLALHLDLASAARKAGCTQRLDACRAGGQAAQADGRLGLLLLEAAIAIATGCRSAVPRIQLIRSYMGALQSSLVCQDERMERPMTGFVMAWRQHDLPVSPRQLNACRSAPARRRPGCKRLLMPCRSISQPGWKLGESDLAIQQR